MYHIKKLIKTSNSDVESNDICENCKRVCYGIRFQRNFKNWSSGNNYIDTFIKVTQLSVHYRCEISNALEWIPYDRFYDIKYISEDDFGKEYRANWIDGYIYKWNRYFKNWKRDGKNMFVILKSLNDPNFVKLNFMNEIEKDHESYGITQDPETKKYMIVLDYKCICNIACHAAIHFQQNFKNWSSGNKDIDKFIQDTQLSAHNNITNALEWIPYDRFDDIRYVEQNNLFVANWIDGCIDKWDNEYHNWKRYNQNMFVTLKNLNNSKIIISEIMNEFNRLYGVTQNPETKNYMLVLNDRCKKCNHVCNAIRFQHNFKSWTSGNENIDKLIQDSQLSAHNDKAKSLEWMSYEPYDRFCDIKYITEDNIHKTNWIDGCIDKWNNSENKNWKRYNQNSLVALKKLNNLNYITREIVNETNGDHHRITWDSKTKNYMMVSDDRCKKHNCDTQLSSHNETRPLEWIPYNGFCDIKYIAVNKIYSANWIDGCIDKWDNENQNWKRNQSMFVTLKILINPNNITREFINKYNFGNWTSGNNNIDRLIQDTQLSAHSIYEIRNALEWIPYDRFCNIKFIAKGGFGRVYKANWIDGRIWDWNNETQNWERYGKNMFVALKSLNNSKDVTFEFMNEITSHHKVKNDVIIGFYGITQDPETKNYVMVLEYAENGSLRDYLDTNCNKLNWERKIRDLCDVAKGLEFIHNNRLIHRDLHIGNILMGSSYKTHSDAIYASRLLNFGNLPEPKNSVNYYEHNHNIISLEFSDSLQINIISQLKW
ncbi:kinase-like domain-containing protein [Rhizophagus clarus]|uniref:Kinase-like domain-containing protein n=1 Tax=Rhizophagus clarus TaxID=94130 RepID=A0A8H3MGV8_9GLOM|nr:kinase-like domain-containing protein [Rhizophagus clarus]